MFVLEHLKNTDTSAYLGNKIPVFMNNRGQNHHYKYTQICIFGKN